jgi:membrane-bound metal-dependent hydrolase YbcI (DUF457 family)
VHAPTHALLSWLVAECAPASRRRDRAVVLLAGLAPDVDALSILGGRACYLEWHRILAHNVLGAALFAGLAAALTRRKAPVLLSLVAYHLHLLCDVLGSAGPDGSNWPVPYLVPFDRDPAHFISWSGQWGLASWQNVAITALAMIACGALGVRRGRTMIEVISPRADAAVVATLRARFTPPPRGGAEGDAPRGPDAPPT